MNAIEQPAHGAKTRRSAAQWQQIIDGYPNSGLSQAIYCRQQGVAISSFHKWKAKLRGQSAAVPEDDFVALSLPVPAQSALWRLELDLGQGCVLRVR